MTSSSSTLSFSLFEFHNCMFCFLFLSFIIFYLLISLHFFKMFCCCCCYGYNYYYSILLNGWLSSKNRLMYSQPFRLLLPFDNVLNRYCFSCCMYCVYLCVHACVCVCMCMLCVWIDSSSYSSSYGCFCCCCWFLLILLNIHPMSNPLGSFERNGPPFV